MNSDGMQWLLGTATRWARENGMTWNTKNGKSEVLIYPGLFKRTFRLEGAELHETRRLEYLGKTVDNTGITEHATLKRISKAKGIILGLRDIGMNAKGLHTMKNISIYKTLVQCLWEYALHLTPWTKSVQAQINQAEGLFYSVILGHFALRLQNRMRSLCKITPLEFKRAQLGEHFAVRLLREKREIEKKPNYEGKAEDLRYAERDISYMKEHDLFSEQIDRTEQGKVTPKEEKRRLSEAWGQAEEGLKRKIPVDRKERTTPTVLLKSRKHRMLAVKWYFGRFPPRNPSSYVDHFGEVAGKSLETLERNLTRPQLNGETEAETMQAMDRLLELEKIMTEEMVV